MNLPTFDDMRDDLNRAYERDVIAYFHIGKVADVTSFISEIFYAEEQFDVYVAIKTEYMAKEDEFKKYMRQRYGHMIRVLVVELHR
jgi:hypothetical protein